MFPLYGKHLQNRVIKIVSIKCLTNEYKATKNRNNDETKSLFVDIFIRSLIFYPILKLI